MAAPANEVTTKIKASDGIQLVVHKVPHADGTKFAGEVVIVHGLGDYSRRHAAWVGEFIKSGFDVTTFDMRGHGESEGPRCHTPSYDQLMDDIQLVLSTTTQQPRFLMGHSMGGQLVAQFVLRRAAKSPTPLDGIVLSAPYFTLPFAPPGWKVGLAGFLGKVAPSLTVTNELDVNGISRIPEEVEIYKKDPLISNKISLMLANTTLAGAKEALENAKNFTLPLFIVHGTGDRLTNFEGSKTFIAAVGTPETDKSIKLYDGAYHEMQHDLNKAEVLADVTAWLVARAQKSSTTA